MLGGDCGGDRSDSHCGAGGRRLVPREKREGKVKLLESIRTTGCQSNCGDRLSVLELGQVEFVVVDRGSGVEISLLSLPQPSLLSA